MISTRAIISKVQQLSAGEAQLDVVFKFVQRAVTERVDSERSELATLALELEVRPTEPEVMAASRRGSDYLVEATASLMRRRFAKLCRDRRQGDEDAGVTRRSEIA